MIVKGQKTKDEATVCVNALVSSSSICPDFDSDCADVPDHVHCFVGQEPRLVFDVYLNEFYYAYTNMAKGKCPYLTS